MLGRTARRFCLRGGTFARRAYILPATATRGTSVTLGSVTQGSGSRRCSGVVRVQTRGKRTKHKEGSESVVVEEGLKQDLSKNMEVVTSLARWAERGEEPYNGFCEDMLAEVRRLGLHTFFNRDLSMISWSLAKLHHNPGNEFLSEVAAAVREKGVQTFYEEELSRLRDMFAKFDFDVGDLFVVEEGETPQEIKKGPHSEKPEASKPRTEIVQEIINDRGPLQNMLKQTLDMALSGPMKGMLPPQMTKQLEEMKMGPSKQQLDKLIETAMREVQDLGGPEFGKALHILRNPEELKGLHEAFRKDNERPGKHLARAVVDLLKRTGLYNLSKEELAQASEWLSNFGFSIDENFTKQMEVMDIERQVSHWVDKGEVPYEGFANDMVAAITRIGLYDFEPQQIASIINGLAQLDAHPGDAFLQEVVAATRSIGLAQHSAQDIDNLLNGFAKFKFDPGHDFTTEAIRERQRSQK